MNKTVAFVSLAAGLALTALVLGLPHVAAAAPRHAGHPPPTPATASNGSLTMTSRLSHPYITPGTSDLFVTVDITGVEVPGSRRTPVNLAVVIDRSGSMSGYKLQQAKQAARHLVGLLGPQDRLAIVHYGSDVKSQPSLPATPANRERMLQYIEGIWDEGGTNIGAGLHAGRSHVAAVAGRLHRQPHHPAERWPAHRGHHRRRGPDGGGEEHPRRGDDGELHRRGHGLQRGPDAGLRRVRGGRVRLPGGRGAAGLALPEGPAAGDHQRGAQRGAVLPAARGRDAGRGAGLPLAPGGAHGAGAAAGLLLGAGGARGGAADGGGHERGERGGRHGAEADVRGPAEGRGRWRARRACRRW